MKRYVFVDWHRVRSTPLQHTYRCGWRELVKWRIAISLGALAVVALIYYLVGGSSAPQRASQTAEPGQSASGQAVRPLIETLQQGRDGTNMERFANAPGQEPTRQPARGDKSDEIDRRAGILGSLGGVFYWTAFGLLGAFALLLPLSSFWRRITIQWDGKNKLAVRSLNFWPSRTSWTRDEIGGIVFGVRERVDRSPRSPPVHQGWFWFIHLKGKSVGGAGHGRVLAEFLASHQDDRPATERALVPHRAMELLKWLESCTGHRAHGPVLVADKKACP